MTATDSFIVDQESNHERLDVFLVKELKGDFSRTIVKKMIETGVVLVNGQPAKVHHKVSTGETIEWQAPVSQPQVTLQAENIPLEIFYEDKSILIVNKPIGMTVHPGSGCSSGTLVNALLYYCQNTPGVTLSDANTADRPGIVHRLDKETSGLIVVAKNNIVHVRLSRQFERRKVKKKYVALVKGILEHDEGVVNAPLGRHPLYRQKKAVTFEDDAKEAETFYRVMRRFPNEVTLVALFPKSGRTHQLRVHMKYLGHPILGDDKYGEAFSFPRLALHAQAISFFHPETKQYIEFSLPIPPEFLHFA
jgi:23S rRNA pseudouridine1911/1915/1917 synthase